MIRRLEKPAESAKSLEAETAPRKHTQVVFFKYNCGVFYRASEASTVLHCEPTSSVLEIWCCNHLSFHIFITKIFVGVNCPNVIALFSVMCGNATGTRLYSSLYTSTYLSKLFSDYLGLFPNILFLVSTGTIPKYIIPCKYWDYSHI